MGASRDWSVGKVVEIMFIQNNTFLKALSTFICTISQNILKNCIIHVIMQYQNRIMHGCSASSYFHTDGNPTLFIFYMNVCHKHMLNIHCTKSDTQNQKNIMHFYDYYFTKNLVLKTVIY